MEDCKRRRQIPPCGASKTTNNELYFTQHFPSGRRAALICNSSGDKIHRHVYSPRQNRRNNCPFQRRARLRGKREANVSQKPRKQQHYHHHQGSRVGDLADPLLPRRQQSPCQPKKQKHPTGYGVVSLEPSPRRKEAVDEDLYKIPDELLIPSSRRKKLRGLLSCFLPFSRSS